MKQFSLFVHNPNFRDVKYIDFSKGKTKPLRDWQHDCMYNYAINKQGNMERFLSIQAFCGSGKSYLQVHLAVYDIVHSGFKQKQLFLVPQEHIHKGFIGDGDLNHMHLLQDGVEYDWIIPEDNNFCTGADRIEKLKKWLLTSSEEMTVGPIQNDGTPNRSIGDIAAVSSHTAFCAAVIQIMKDPTISEEQKKQLFANTTLRLDEAHHIKGVYIEDELEDAEKMLVDKTSSILGRICRNIINSDDVTSKIHLTTATLFRGDHGTILFPKVRSKFVEYFLDWIEHFSKIGIETFSFSYEEYVANPIKQIVKNILNRPNGKHYVVLPSVGQKWRKEESLQMLLNELYKIYPSNRVLDLVTPETQKKNKKMLLSEPKINDPNNPSKFDVIVVCQLGREGTDWCCCSAIHNTSVENSVTLALQTLGRLFRLFDGKTVVEAIHYVRQFELNSNIKREIFTDRNNMILMYLQMSEMIYPIFVEPKIPEEGGANRGYQKSTLWNVFGSEFLRVKVDLIEGYELLETKSEEQVRELCNEICKNYGVEPNESIVDALLVLILRAVSKTPEIKSIDVSFIRQAGFDKVEKFQSLYFGDYKHSDYKTVRDIVTNKLLSLDKKWDVIYEEVERIGVENIRPGHKYHNWLMEAMYKARKNINLRKQFEDYDEV